jgi:membrane-associated phospholipid phosphatase
MTLHSADRTNEGVSAHVALGCHDEPTWVELSTGTADDSAEPAVTQRRSQVIVATLLALFGILAVAVVWHDAPLAGDRSLGAQLLRHRGEVGWTIADVVSFCASGAMVALVAAAAGAWLIFARRQIVDAVAVVAAPAFAGGVEVVMKAIISRPRPLTAVLSGESGNGFPSGHVTGYAALTVALLVVFVLTTAALPLGVRRMWTVTTILAIVLVMWSRVALGAHYVSDTIGGCLLGAAIGLAAVPVAAWFAAVLRRRLASTSTPSRVESA